MELENILIYSISGVYIVIALLVFIANERSKKRLDKTIQDIEKQLFNNQNNI